MFVQPKRPYLVNEHAESRRLRRDGVPIRLIARTLGVSLSTVSVWVRDIELLPEQVAHNLKRAGSVRGEACRLRARDRRLGFQEAGRQRAREMEALHLSGCMLYWAEGSKGRNCVHFANSDPAMLSLFKRFATECFDLAPERFTFNINAYTTNGLSIETIEQHWMEVLDLPRSCARKHILNHFPTSSSGLRPKKLIYGVCSLKITKSTQVVQHIYGAIQEYSGIDQPQWLDGPQPTPEPSV